MSAGTGVRHSEFNGSKSEPVRSIQIWIEPRKSGLEPRYGERSFDFAPGTVTTVASGTGDGGALPIYQDASVSVARVADGAGVTHAVGSDGTCGCMLRRGRCG